MASQELSSDYDTPLHQIVRDSHVLGHKTKIKYLTGLDHFFRFVQVTYPARINDPAIWTQKTVEAFHRALLAEGKTAGTANGAIYALRYAAKWFARREVQPHIEDFPRIELPRLSEEKRDPLTFDEARLILETTRGKHPRDLRDRALIVVALETGMRRMSLSGMDWGNFSKSGGLDVCTVPIKRNKYGDTYAVPFSETALRSLKPWGVWLKKQGIVDGPIFRSLNTNALPYKVGTTPLTVDAIYDVIVKRAKQAGLEHKHPHELRHTFVSWRLNDDVPAFAVMAVTGHLLDRETPEIMKRYSGVMVAERALKATPGWLKDLVIDLE